VSSVLRHPGVARLLALNVLPRVATAGSSVLLVVFVHALTGSFAAAGVVAAGNALATAGAAPLLGGLVDRRGQTLVLAASGLAAGAAYLALAALPARAPLGALLVLATVAGASQPPLGACLRTLWPSVLGGDRAAVRTAFALEAVVLELTYISGPLGFLTLAALASSRLAVAVLGALMLAGTLAFAAEPASRAWRPAVREDAERRRPSGLAAPGVRTIAAVMFAVGVLVAGVEVAVTAAMSDAGTTAATGPLLAVWGAGSLLGGVVAARTGGARDARGLVGLLLALAVTHAVLAVAGPSVAVLAALLTFAGAWIAPLFSATGALTGELAVPGTTTEAFAWTTTALAAGVALGAAMAGALADTGGSGIAFVASGAAGLVAAAVAAGGARTLHAGAGAAAAPAPC
jgi:hypothetical protein